MEIISEFRVKIYNNETDSTKDDRFSLLKVGSNIKQFMDCCMNVNGRHNVIQLLENAKDGDIFIDNFGAFWKYDEDMAELCYLSTNISITGLYTLKHISELRFAPIITAKEFFSNLDVGSVISVKDKYNKIRRITIVIEENEEDGTYDVCCKDMTTGEYIIFI